MMNMNPVVCIKLIILMGMILGIASHSTDIDGYD